MMALAPMKTELELGVTMSKMILKAGSSAKQYLSNWTRNVYLVPPVDLVTSYGRTRPRPFRFYFTVSLVANVVQ